MDQTAKERERGQKMARSSKEALQRFVTVATHQFLKLVLLTWGHRWKRQCKMTIPLSTSHNFVESGYAKPECDGRFRCWMRAERHPETTRPCRNNDNKPKRSAWWHFLSLCREEKWKQVIDTRNTYILNSRKQNFFL